MQFNVVNITLPGSKICLGFGKEIVFDVDDRTVQLGGRWLKYKKSDTRLDELRVKDSDKAVFTKPMAFSYKETESLVNAKFLCFGVPPFLDAIVKKNIGKGLVMVSMAGVEETIIELDWSEHLVDFDTDSVDAFDRLYDVFFGKDGQWIFGLDLLQEKVLEFLIDNVRCKNEHIDTLAEEVTCLTKDKTFYKEIVKDLVNTVVPTTPTGVWDMDSTDNGRSAQAQAVGSATTVIAELIRKEKPVKHLTPRALMMGTMDNSELGTEQQPLPHIRKVRGPGLVQVLGSVKHLDQPHATMLNVMLNSRFGSMGNNAPCFVVAPETVEDPSKNLEMTFVEKFLIAPEIWNGGGNKDHLLSSAIKKIAK